MTLALDASVEIASEGGERTMKIEDFIVGPLTSALEPGEILVQVRVPLPAARTGSAYEKHPHPASRFAVAGVAAVLTLDASGAVQGARLVVTGLGSKATRAAAAEKALVGRKPDAAAIKAAAAQVTEGIEVRDDLNGTAAYRKNLAAVMAERAIGRAAARAAGA